MYKAVWTATKWDTPEDKARFEKQFKTFALRGFLMKDFPNTFYTRLSMCFGFIAHYDRSGFYSTYFTQPADTVEFLKAVLEHPCYGDPAWTYSDVERAIQEWLKTTGVCVLNEVRAYAGEVLEAQERAELTRLQAKYQ